MESFVCQNVRVQIPDSSCQCLFYVPSFFLFVRPARRCSPIARRKIQRLPNACTHPSPSMHTYAPKSASEEKECGTVLEKKRNAERKWIKYTRKWKEKQKKRAVLDARAGLCARFAFAEQRAYTSLHNNNLRIHTHSRPHMHNFFTRISQYSRNESNKLFIHAAASPAPAMMMTIILVFFLVSNFFNVRFVWLFLLFFFSFCFVFFISSLSEYIMFCVYSHSRASIPFGRYTISISCRRHRQYTFGPKFSETRVHTVPAYW